MNRRTATALLAAALICSSALAGCGGDTEAPRSPGSATSRSSSPDPAPDDPAPDDSAPSDPGTQALPTDPCDFVERSDYISSVPRKERRYVTEIPKLNADRVPFYMCDVRVNGYAWFSLGYALAEGAFGDARREDRQQDSLLKVEGVGDEAYISDTSVFPAAVAAVGPETVRYEVALLRSDRRSMRPALAGLVELAQERGIVHGPAIDLGEGCPAADSAAVRGVVGNVVWARGGPDSHGVPHCQYRSNLEQSTMLTMGATQYTPQRFREDKNGGIFGAAAEQQGYDVDSDTEVLDPPPGRTAKISGESFGITLLATYPTPHVNASVNTQAIGIIDPRRGSRESVKRVARLWFANAEPAINAIRP